MNIYICVVILLSLFSCSKSDLNSQKEIRLAETMEHPVQLKATDFTPRIEYIPLETTDGSLVGDLPYYKILKELILVSSLDQPLKAFDRKTGKFLNNIGHLGEGPKAYLGNGGILSFWVNQKEDRVYIIHEDGKSFQTYDMKGMYGGKVRMEENALGSTTLWHYQFLLSGDTIWGHYKFRSSFDFNRNLQLNCFKSGIRIDSVLCREEPRLGNRVEDLVMRGAEIQYGGPEAYFEFYEKNKSVLTVPGSPSIWMYDHQLRIKENFIDTIYTVNGDVYTPYLIFNLGKWHWGYEERYDKEVSKDRIMINYILEGQYFVYFHFMKGLYERIPTNYCGIFDKETGKTIINQNLWIEDDIYFQSPFYIRGVSSDGNFFGVTQAYEMLQWNEEKKSSLPESLQNIGEEDNPVVIIMN